METKKAIQHLSSASGMDAIPVVIYNAGGLPMSEKLTDLLQCLSMLEAITHEFNDAFIFYLCKWKANPQICNNNRGISLLSIGGKVLEKIQYVCLNVHFDQTGLLQETQFGFRKDREEQ